MSAIQKFCSSQAATHIGWPILTDPHKERNLLSNPQQLDKNKNKNKFKKAFPASTGSSPVSSTSLILRSFPTFPTFCPHLVQWKINVDLPILCWFVCRTAPNAIRSLTGGARLPRAAKPSPRNDASATALRGALDASVRILLSNISKLGGDMVMAAMMRRWWRRWWWWKDARTLAANTHTHTHEIESAREREIQGERERERLLDLDVEHVCCGTFCRRQNTRQLILFSFRFVVLSLFNFNSFSYLLLLSSMCYYVYLMLL